MIFASTADLHTRAFHSTVESVVAKNAILNADSLENKGTLTTTQRLNVCADFFLNKHHVNAQSCQRRAKKIEQVVR